MTAPAPQTPGVSIVELSSTSLSVQGSATAVPVFIGRFLNLDGTPAAGGQCIRINSWLEFTKRFAESTTYSISVPFVELSKSFLQLGDKKIKRTKKSLTPVATPYIGVLVESCEGGGKLVYKCDLSHGFFDPGDGSGPNYHIAVRQLHSDLDTAKKDIDFTYPGRYFTDKQSSKLELTPTIYWTDTEVLDEDAGVLFFEVDAIKNESIVTSLELDFVYSGSGSWMGRGTGYICNGVVITSPAVGSATAVMSYFQNSGGPCYILPLAGADELDALPALIEEHPEITLLVCPETDEGLAELDSSKNDVYLALMPLLTPDKGYFLIADADSSGAAPLALAQSDHAAVYYPNVVTSLKRSRPADEYIEVTGYTDSNGDLVNTLAALKVQNPSIYPVVSSVVDQYFAEQDYLTLPPSALMAGAYARTDRERGVWKAPANIPLKGVRGLETVISETAQGPLNKVGINVIRWFSDRGPVVYGARTLAVDSKEWLYVPVRRLFNMAERDIKRSLSTLVFEPNNQITWERARSAIYNYLAKLWHEGALQGDKAEEAFYVQVGLGITMTEAQIDAGQLIVKVGMAAVRPAEFIILQFTQDVQ